MKNKGKVYIWICLVLCLIPSFSGIAERFSNETANKSVVLVADYDRFVQSTDIKEANSVLAELKNNNVKILAVSEMIDINGIGEGFDKNLLSKLKAKGFELLLRLSSKHAENFDYNAEYGKVIENFHIRYVIFSDSIITGYPNKLNVIENIFKAHGIITGMVEASSQVGYRKQTGFNRFVQDMDYDINRMYVIPEDDLKILNGSELFFRWMRSVVDRNIRFIYIVPLKSPNINNRQNIGNTLEAAKKLSIYLSGKGYEINSPLHGFNTQPPGKLHDMTLVLSTVLAVLLYIGFIPSNHLNIGPWFYIAAILSVLTISSSILLFEWDLSGYIAVLAALIYPSISSLLFLRYLKSSRQKPFFLRMFTSLGIILGVNLLGIYTILASMSDIRYILNTKTYNGVIQSYVFPLVFFLLNYIVCFKNPGSIYEILNKIKLIKFKSVYLFWLLLFCLIFYIYLSRSGNFSLIPATRLELWLRERLEFLLMVRPRFKEFLIGYPCLFFLVYLIHKSKNQWYVILLGIGTVIGSISMTNSFCHGFTPISVSVLRSINGLILGTALSLILLIIHKLMTKQSYIDFL